MDFHHNQQEGGRLNDLMLPAPREFAQKEEGDDEVPKLNPENELDTGSLVEVKERKRKVPCDWSEGEATALLEAHGALCAEKMTRYLRLDDWKDIETAVNSKNTWPPKTVEEFNRKIHTVKSKCCNSSSSKEAHPCERSDNARATEHGTGTRSTVPMAGNQDYYSVSKGGYNARMAVPHAVDALQQGSLQEDVVKLLKERHDAEDAEHSLHCERLNAINWHYQDKLVALLIEQGRIRQEFLRKEFQSRFQRYRQFQNTNSMAPY